MTPAEPALPSDLRAALDANEAVLRELAAALGGEVRAIERALRERWTAPTSHYEHVRVLETEHRGTRVAIVANFLRSSTSERRPEARVRFVAQHRVAAIRPDARVASVLDTCAYAVPFVGEVKVPHFEHGAQPSSAAESAWLFDGAHRLPEGGATFRFAGCYDGVLYANVGGASLDRSEMEKALDALVDAAALPWRAPTDEERRARRARAMSRARRRLAIGCLVHLAVLGLIGWGIHALVT
ncbi:MAG TPA: hypothetical protein VIL20_28510 [Sandaracinaceae bacterium]